MKKKGARIIYLDLGDVQREEGKWEGHQSFIYALVINGLHTSYLLIYVMAKMLPPDTENGRKRSDSD